MNDPKKNQTWIIVGALVGCLGCGGVILLGGLFVFGMGMFGGGIPAATPLPITTPVAPIVAPDGWTVFQHAGACPGNDNLQITSFRVAYSSQYNVLPCREQQPQPWAYVTFHLESPQGAAVRQVTMGYANGPVTPVLLQQAADSLTPQLGAGVTRNIDVSPLMARGASLMRRDSAFDVSTRTGPFVPGTYIYRQVVVPNGAQHLGIMVTLMQPAPQGEAAALAETQAELLRVIESLQY